MREDSPNTLPIHPFASVTAMLRRLLSHAQFGELDFSREDEELEVPSDPQLKDAAAWA